MIIEDILNKEGINIKELYTSKDFEILAKKIMTTSALLYLTQKEIPRVNHLPLKDENISLPSLRMRLRAINERPLSKSLVSLNNGEKNSQIDYKIAFFFLNLSSRAIDNNLTTSEIANLPKQVLKLDALNIDEAEQKLNLKLKPSKIKNPVIPKLEL